ncbi:TetR/AcrR family transcriptional regulator [Sporosarcina sp.]|uniref:TetR/AcrR family transcriptional regulator n=1 Tax=Sporosarcina sp. TaxID=49982 RepID=UPI00261E7853|nr:TetR/AcrR family transcriptional regulator [Sporosarcina sp.]
MSLREKKVEKKKDEIRQSAMSVIAEKGYHATTMEDIAAKLLMTKGSVYYYFKDKEDLVFESQKMLLEQGIEHLENVMSQEVSTGLKLHNAMVVHIEYLITERTDFFLGAKPDQVFNGEHLQEILRLRNKYSDYIDQLIQQGMKDGSFKKVDSNIVKNIILGAMNNVIIWYSPKGSKNKNELANSIADYLLQILV